MKKNLQTDNTGLNYRKSGIDLTQHKHMCHQFFEHIKNGCPFYIRVNDTISVNNEENYYSFSLVTEEVIDYDSEMLSIQNPEELLYKHRPYFISFLVSSRKNNNRILQSLGDSWFEGRFIEETIMPAEYAFNEEAVLLDGLLEIAASPVNTIQRRALIFKNRSISPKILDRIKQTYNTQNISCVSNDIIEKILNNAWANDFPDTIDIYNVGHGNADYIRGISNHKILYDIGYDRPNIPARFHSRYKRAVNALRHVKPGCVILSH